MHKDVRTWRTKREVGAIVAQPLHEVQAAQGLDWTHMLPSVGHKCERVIPDVSISVQKVGADEARGTWEERSHETVSVWRARLSCRCEQQVFFQALRWQPQSLRHPPRFTKPDRLVSTSTKLYLIHRNVTRWCAKM